MLLLKQIFVSLSIYFTYIDICIQRIACYIFIYSSEQQKIESGFFLFEAEQKAKKAKKDIAGKCGLHIHKHIVANDDEKDIIEVDRSDESTTLDENLKR